MEIKLKADSEPFEKIKGLTQVNLYIFEIIDKLKGFEVGLAPMKLRDATIEIQLGMAKLADELHEKQEE